MSDLDLAKLKVADLKAELKKRGLSVTGNKNELQDRLQTAILEGGHGLDDTGADDLLDDDLMDDELDEKELLGHGDEHEDELLQESPSPDASEQKHVKHSASSITSTAESTTTTTQVPHKKISLKRNLSVPKPVLPETTSDETKSISSTNGSGDNSDEPDKKVVKLTQLSSEERLKLRAQKFGASSTTTTVEGAATTTTTVDVDEKKQARAARFGISSTTTSGSSASIKGSAPEVSVELLKKRAERFGASTAPKLNAIELDEKLKKRQERFGASATTTLPSDQAEKAKLRLERFKTAA